MTEKLQLDLTTGSKETPSEHLVIPDHHAYPGDNFERFEWLGELILERQPPVIIDIGDGWDMPSLCVAPDTLILTNSMEWVKASELKEGDGILGFDEYPENKTVGKSFRKFKLGYVTNNVRFISKKGFKVLTTHGEIECSHDHKFLSHNLPNGAKREFRNCSELKIGWKIQSLGSDWHSNFETKQHSLTEQEIGYLQGFLDGEGYYGNGRLSWSQNNGEVADYVHTLMSKLGCDVKFYTEENRPLIKHYYIKGSYLESWKVLHLLRPKRLLPKFLQDLHEKTLSKFSGSVDAEILDIEPLENLEVIGLETNIKTYISNSLLSHNCSYDKGKKSFVFQNVQEDIEAGHRAESLIYGPMVKYNNTRAQWKKKQYNPLIVKFLGNHEARVAKLLEYEPRWEGVISMDNFNTRMDISEIVVDFLDYAIIDDIAYSHYFVSGVMGRPCSSARALLSKKLMSCTMGHTHTLDGADGVRADGVRARALVCGSFHDKSHKGFAGSQVDSIYWNGLIYKTNVFNGDYDREEIGIDRLERMYK